MGCLAVDRLVPEETGALRNFQNEVGGTGGEGRGGEQCLGSQFRRGLSSKSHSYLEIKLSTIVICAHLLDVCSSTGFLLIYYKSLGTLRLVSDE